MDNGYLGDEEMPDIYTMGFYMFGRPGNQGQTYRKWRQDAPCYNDKEAWPARLFPDAMFHLFRDGGELLTSLAIMLRHYGIEKEEDEENFNPWILNQKLIADSNRKSVDFCILLHVIQSESQPDYPDTFC